MFILAIQDTAAINRGGRWDTSIVVGVNTSSKYDSTLLYSFAYHQVILKNKKIERSNKRKK